MSHRKHYCYHYFYSPRTKKRLHSRDSCFIQFW